MELLQTYEWVSVKAIANNLPWSCLKADKRTKSFAKEMTMKVKIVAVACLNFKYSFIG